jgi:voltage-gated potassium channel
VPISSVVRAADNELPARQAGADNVINPVHFTGLLLAGSAQGSHIADYLMDLASASGRVQLIERAATAEEIGKPLDALPGRGLRIYRQAASIGLWEAGAPRLEAGDIVVQIVPTTPHAT